MNAQDQVLARLIVTEPDDGDPTHTRYAFRSESTGGVVELVPTLEHQPAGIESAALKARIKYEDTLDFMVVKLPRRGAAAGVFTRNRSVSPAITIDRAHLSDGRAQALCVISKNANVFTPTAYDDARRVVSGVAGALGLRDEDVLLSCTGVIGQPLPMDRIEAALARVPGALAPGLSDDVARAILTTDREMKVASVRVGDVVLTGMAKGAGMIEPNMATMLVYFFTNLALEPAVLGDILRRTADATFNAISVDTDTSTSDSVILFSSEEVPASDALTRDFEAALAALCLKLARDVVFQAEGSTKLVEVSVRGCPDDAEARIIAKQVVNSPLMKSAIFGADPNWGRVVMAIGKPGGRFHEPLDPRTIRIALNGTVLFDQGAAVHADLDALSRSIRDHKKSVIDVTMGSGPGHFTVWGCDLSYDYVRINAEYTS